MLYRELGSAIQISKSNFDDVSTQGASLAIVFYNSHNNMKTLDLLSPYFSVINSERNGLSFDSGDITSFCSD